VLGLFGAVWLAGAAYNARRAPVVRERSGLALSWLVWVAAVWLLFRLVPRSDWNPLTVHGSGVRVLGVVVLVASTAFTLWARGALGTMWSSTPVAREGHQLRTGGPYGITRHPIYTGLLGMVLGTSLVAGLGQYAVAVAVVALGLEVKIHYEERLMTRAFPGDYEEYRRRVPQLVPGLYMVPGIGHR